MRRFRQAWLGGPLAAWAEQDSAIAERDSVAAERDGIAAERDALASQNDRKRWSAAILP